jgi:hypothetical protein
MTLGEAWAITGAKRGQFKAQAKRGLLKAQAKGLPKAQDNGLMVLAEAAALIKSRMLEMTVGEPMALVNGNNHHTAGKSGQLSLYAD